MVKVKNKVLVALSILLCAVLLSGVFVFIDNTKSLNADTETQSQNGISVQSGENDLAFPTNWSQEVAGLYGVDTTDMGNVHDFERYIRSIIFTQSIPDGYDDSPVGTLSSGLPVYQKITKEQETIDNETKEVNIYNLAFVNANGRITAPANSQALFGGGIYQGPSLDDNLQLIKFETFEESVEVNNQVIKSKKSVFDTSGVTNMTGLFTTIAGGPRYELQIEGFEYLDTMNVTTMRDMFSFRCKNFTINLTNLNTSNVEDMSGMFNGCTELTEINLNAFDISNVKDISGMFNGCESLTNINISKFNMVNVENMSGMFKSCSNLETIEFPKDASLFNTEKVTDMSSMFEGCTSLKSLDLSLINSQAVTTIQSMFKDCSSLSNLKMGNITITGTNAQGVLYLFNNCSSLKNIDLSGIKVNNDGSLWCLSIFDGCSSLSTLDISGFSFQGKFVMSVFDGCTSLKKIVLPENIGEGVSIDLPIIEDIKQNIEKADHFGYVDENNQIVSITTDGESYINSDLAGKTIELYDNTNNSLVIDAPQEPETGINANVIAIVCSIIVVTLIVLIYIIVSSKKTSKKKLNAINIDTNRRN